MAVHSITGTNVKDPEDAVLQDRRRRMKEAALENPVDVAKVGRDEAVLKYFNGCS